LPCLRFVTIRIPDKSLQKIQNEQRSECYHLKTMIRATQQKSFTLISVSLILVSISYLFASTASAQRNEMGVFFGGSYYLGDLNPARHFAMMQIGAGAIYRYNINENLALRLNGFMGNVAGSDARIQYNTNRNLQFRSKIAELSLQGEVNFLHFIPGDPETPATPYIFGGGGIFRFNPQAEINGQWYNLKQLTTEGQGSELYPDRKPYSLTSTIFLFGIGYKFNINRQFTAAFEWGMRRTGTDYLDDVSTTYPNADVFGGNSIALEVYDRSLENRGENENFQRGNPNTNDWYSFAGIVLTIRIKDFNRHKCPAYN
jgi:hypothetical protein